MSDVENKIKFIVAWYNNERTKFSFPTQILLAKTWMEICTKNEEYEMALALKKEKEKLVKNYLAKKRSERTWKEKLRFFFLKLKRKLR